ncbi:SKP1-like protein 1B [Solanum verrucosum]|uniref:SKP1-like protein 1B n=1 Tax=Solanum verrucosum TaxID=315347 RepID=UPI0020D1CB72|nr:SKP1-like protein 1B [Solanum verrucosum]
MSSEKFITLKTSDGEEFKFDETIAVMSEIIKNIVQDQDCASNVIPLSNVDGKIMTKVIEYWKKHSEKGVSENQLKNFDKNFLKVHSSVLIDVLLAAKNLDDKELRDVMSQEVADKITGKTPKEIREEFDIVNDYTPEEEGEVRRENAWAFE